MQRPVSAGGPLHKEWLMRRRVNEEREHLENKWCLMENAHEGTDTGSHAGEAARTKAFHF